MERKPILVVMAAGMGSRYGGLKQIDPVGGHGEALLDYSIFDAWRAGFRKAVIIIKKSIEKDFMDFVAPRQAHIGGAASGNAGPLCRAHRCAGGGIRRGTGPGIPVGTAPESRYLSKYRKTL